MKRRLCPRRSRERGSAIIVTMFMLLIISILLMGVGNCVVSHQSRASTDADYAAAIEIADGGVNYEFRQISKNTANADQYPGNTYTLGNGTFTVYCTNADGSTPWIAPNPLYVISTATVDGVSRTVKASGIGSGSNANYAVFAVKTGVMNGSAINIQGNVGTNGTLAFNADPTVNGGISFNGPGSNWSGSAPGGYNVTYNPSPVLWPTVSQLANTAFPKGGLSWLSKPTNNDNGLCFNISNNQLIANGNKTITLSGKAGGANYYLTSLVMSGGAKITFNNTQGPVNIWIGPSGGNGNCTFNGGSASIAMATDPTKACHIYAATSTGITQNGNIRLDAELYAYDTDSNGNAIGQVINNGNEVTNGGILANSVTLNGNPTVNAVTGILQNSNGGYYGYNNSWLEENPR